MTTNLSSAEIKAILGVRPVILCIGSDRVTGDCLGPITGELLVNNGIDAYVYGTLSFPVTAVNLADVLKGIKLRHLGKKILAIDSSVGKRQDVGRIAIMKGALKPGSADGKKLPAVGDVSITATVTDLSFAPLASVRLGEVYRLSVKICDLLCDCFPLPIYSTQKV